MKLNKKFIVHESSGDNYIVSVGQTNFHGLVRSNKTAAFIVNCLTSETTAEEIVDKMLQKYDAPREVIEADVQRILNTLRSIGALDENNI